jgi:DNA mismatch endonuclease (patch repair protein)
MPDVLTPDQRRRNMQAIRARDTKPEMKVRKLLHGLGYRYRLHRRDLPGTPDLVFPKRRKTIFVHGCFWHMHDCRYGTVVPRTNADFWQRKRESNVARDTRHLQDLRDRGWDVLTVWECWTRDPDGLHSRLVTFLEAGDDPAQDAAAPGTDASARRAIGQ